jgi:GT2 family glycosyltransferase
LIVISNSVISNRIVIDNDNYGKNMNYIINLKNIMRISASIVLYNNSPEQIDLVVKCVLNSYKIERLYIIDNSPVENYYSELYKNNKIKYQFTGKNNGYGAGHNIAIRETISNGYDYHLVINPDVSFKKDTIDKLSDYMNKNSGIVNIMPKVLYPDGSMQYLCKLLPAPVDWIGRRFFSFFSGMSKRNRKFELQFTGYNKIIDAPYLSGCFMFLRLSALEKTGLFDEKIFMYGEDTDLCRRLNMSGYRTVYYPDAEIIHEFQKGSHKSLKLTWVSMKSAIYYFNKWGWFFDKSRREINKITLKKLGYN